MLTLVDCQYLEPQAVTLSAKTNINLNWEKRGEKRVENINPSSARKSVSGVTAEVPGQEETGRYLTREVIQLLEAE